MDNDPSVNMFVTISNKPKVFSPSICMLILYNINEIIFGINIYGLWVLNVSAFIVVVSFIDH